LFSYSLRNSTSTYTGFPHRIPSYLCQTSSSSSAGTASSRVTSYYSSLRSTREHDQTSKQSSSTTLYASSHRSDSLFNQPTRKKTGQLLTTSFHSNTTDNARLKFYREVSTTAMNTDEVEQVSSTINIDTREKVQPTTIINNLSTYRKWIFDANVIMYETFTVYYSHEFQSSHMFARIHSLYWLIRG
jgi:hypothetical protein